MESQAADQPYSRKNPPPTIAHAHERLETLSFAEAHIQIQLEHTPITDYSNDEDYFAWKGRAMAAFAYQRVEISFLERWLVEQQFLKQLEVLGDRTELLSFKVLETSAQVPLQVVVASIVERIIGEMRARYRQRYTDKLLPADNKEAVARRQEVADTVHIFGGHLRAMQLLVGAVNIKGEAAELLLRPAITLLHAATLESSVLKKFLSVPGVKDFSMVFVEMAKRFAAEGFTLTEQEATAIAHFLELRQLTNAQ